MAPTWTTLFRAFLPVRIFKEILVKIFPQPPQDSEMGEGSGVDDYHDAASDHFICESSESGEIQAHHGPPHNIEQEDKSKLHPDSECEAEEGGDGTLKKMENKIFQQPPQDSEMVAGNGVDDDHSSGLDWSIRQSSEGGESEAYRSSTYNIEQEDKSKLHPVTEGDAHGEVHGTLKPIRESQFIDQHVAQHPLSSNCRRRGKRRATTTGNDERKKRQRCKNWTDLETKRLVELRLESSRNEESVRKNKSKEPVWEAISKQIPGRTPKQCQRRWDTVVRYDKKSKSRLGGHNMQFSEVTTKVVQEMEAPYFRSAESFQMFGTRTSSSDLSEPTAAAHELSPIRCRHMKLQNMKVATSTRTKKRYKAQGDKEVCLSCHNAK